MVHSLATVSLRECVCVVTLNFGDSVVTFCRSYAAWLFFSGGAGVEVPHQPGQPFKFTVTESCDRIKEEFQFLQAQYHR